MSANDVITPTSTPAPTSNPTSTSTPTPTPTIASQINAATRHLHAELNRLILARLPLALPPHATDPLLYASGLAVFGGVYATFEEQWRGITTDEGQGCEQLGASVADVEHVHRLHCFLRGLVPVGLERSGRLKRDLAPLQGSHIPGAHEIQYRDHIITSTDRSPHVLIAYAWVMYMAIFSGGRYIRAELARAGDDFWQKGLVEPNVSLSGMKGKPTTDGSGESQLHDDAQFGFSFLSFDGDSDGEDIKAEFKRRLACAEDILTMDERRDVMAEAQQVFRYSILLVREIDQRVPRIHSPHRVWRLGRSRSAALCCAVGLGAWWCIHWGLGSAIA